MIARPTAPIAPVLSHTFDHHHLHPKPATTRCAAIQCSLNDHQHAPNTPLPRRAILPLLTAAGCALLTPPLPALAADVPLATASQPLAQTFTSSEGFTFSFPTGWVVAYDRSGSRGDGAVVAVGDFTRFLVVSVFRKVDIPDDVRTNGLDEATGRALCLDPLAAAETTLRFKDLRSEAAAGGAYDFEYEIEVCRGETQEGVGGVLRCLGGAGQEIPTMKRHHMGRAVVSNGRLLTINAAAPIEKWAEVEGPIKAIIESYRAT